MHGVYFNLNGLSKSIYEVTIFLKSHNYYYLGKNCNKVSVSRNNKYFFKVRNREEEEEIFNLLSNFIGVKSVSYKLENSYDNFEEYYHHIRTLAKILY